MNEPILPKWMIVDDNEQLLKLIRKMLSQTGEADIHCFLSAREALKAIEAAPGEFQLIVSDLEMPEMDGFHFCHALRRSAPEAKVILATANPDISEEEARQKGFSCLLRKPFPCATLYQAITALNVTPFSFNLLQTPGSISVNSTDRPTAASPPGP